MAVYRRDPITGTETTVAGIQDLAVYENRISNIEEVIPSDTTTGNKLVNEGELGTAASKDYTTNVEPNNHNLVESNAVYNAIATSISSIYKVQGDLTCAELVSGLLIASNVGNVYNMTDSGTTSDLFVQGAGVTINTNDTVSIIQTGVSEYKFNYMGNLIDLHNYQTKELSSTIAGETTVEGALNQINSNVGNYVNLVGGKNILPNGLIGTTTTKNGVTCTVFDDGSITLNGTATADAQFLFIDNTVTKITDIFPVEGNYKIVSDFDANSTARIFLGCWHDNGWVTPNVWLENDYTKHSFTIPKSYIDDASSYTLRVGLQVYSGNTYDNERITVFITADEVTDETYVPYAPSSYQSQWKKLAQVTGKTVVSLPSYFEELRVYVSTSAQWDSMTFSVLRKSLKTTERNYITGWMPSSTTACYSHILVSLTSLQLAASYINGAETTTTSIVEVYYR